MAKKSTTKTETNGNLAKSENIDISPIFDDENSPENDTPKATVKIEGIESESKAKGFELSPKVAELITLAATASGVSPEAIIGKVLTEAFTSETFALIKLFRTLASEQGERNHQEEIERIEHLKAIKRREIQVLEMEAQAHALGMR